MDRVWGMIRVVSTIIILISIIVLLVNVVLLSKALIDLSKAQDDLHEVRSTISKHNKLQAICYITNNASSPECQTYREFDKEYYEWLVKMGSSKND